MRKTFSVLQEERKKKMKEFQEILNIIDRDVIMEVFKEGLKVGFFGKRGMYDDLFIQFNDGGKFVYTISRMPIKRKQKQNIIEKTIL